MGMIIKGKLAQISLQTLFLTLFLGGCASTIPEPHQPSEGHISVDEKAAVTTSNEIPEIVQKKAFLPPPVPQPSEQDLERYTVVVNDVPVKELLFALARDASLNIDVDSDIQGFVTMNAVEQTLPQILERISRQAGLRYELKGNNLYISPDDPYFRTYNIDYVNISRDTEGSISVSTQIATTGTADVTSTGSGGSSSGTSNNSTTEVNSTSNHRFWNTITRNIHGILGEESTSSTEGLGSKNVIVNSESGVINVRATSQQHLDIQEFVDKVLLNAQRQVLIEATIVEVTLNNRFQAGVDWNIIDKGLGLNITQNSILSAAAGFTTATPFFSAGINRDDNNFNATIDLLKQFGDTKVLSSPKLMTLNNQTSILKVVNNVVYFTIEANTSQNQNNSLTTVESEIHTVPVGFIMSVTPQINENNSVTMNVRPTISRISGFKIDPGPLLAQAQLNQLAAQLNSDNDPTNDIALSDLVINNEIPEIQVREMESVLKVNSGQVAILGGLMQDDYQRNTSGIPGLGDVPVVGNAFKQRDFQNTKSELIIFLRPIVMHNASLTGDLSPYRRYLQDNATTPLPIPK